LGNLGDELGLTLVVSNMVADDNETFQMKLADTLLVSTFSEAVEPGTGG
jgi:hypothetical protein